MNRNDALTALHDEFDVLVIGGGATGLGVALDAVTRGFRTVLVEAGDFAQATSSRATKLAHGGVRYLASGQVHLVYEALHERAVMRKNAPHLVHAQPFVLPAYSRMDIPFYGTGLMLYDFISGKATMGPTRILGAKATAEKIPNIEMQDLRGGILYHDGQFNDARLALTIARTAAEHGAVVLNYAQCLRLEKRGEKISGALISDVETGKEYSVKAKLVINAAGIFSDSIRHMDEPAKPALLTVSRGTHIVVDAGRLGGSTAIMVPKTRDGRVIFAIPWQGRVVIGTTDLADAEPKMEPGHDENEIDFLIETINPFLAKKIGRDDILAVFSGQRPLVSHTESSSAKISREHFIDVSPHGLVTIAGGKWTTYRRMAEDTLNFAMQHGLLAHRACRTKEVKLHGWKEDDVVDLFFANPFAGDPYLREYGSDAEEIEQMIAGQPELGARVDAALPYSLAQAVFAVRHEMARTVEDVLSRRTRALLLDAKAAERAASRVADVIAAELKQDRAWAEHQVWEFTTLAQQHYTLQ